MIEQFVCCQLIPLQLLMLQLAHLEISFVTPAQIALHFQETNIN